MSFPVVHGTQIAMPAPKGWQVDLAHPATDTSTITTAYWLFGFETIIAVTFLSQRIYTNGILLRRFRTDDYLIVAAFLLSIAAQTSLLYAYSHGLLGVHAWEMSIEDYNMSTLLVLLTTLTYIPTTILSKLTLCFFYYRLSPSQWYRYSVWVTGVICAGSLIGIWFSILFACKPISAAWDIRVASTATCIDRPPIYITQAAFGCATDVLLLALPVPTVIELQMSTRQKIGVLGMFGIGSITLITSIVRLVLLLPSLATPDQSWSLAEGCLWVIVEASLLIMCGSLPTLRVFLRHTAPRVLGERSQDSRKKSSGGNFNLRTIGGTDATRPQLDTLAELEYRDFEHSVRPHDGENKVKVSVYDPPSGEGSVDGDLTGENESEQGILQTRSFAVSRAK